MGQIVCERKNQMTLIWGLGNVHRSKSSLEWHDNVRITESPFVDREDFALSHISASTEVEPSLHLLFPHFSSRNCSFDALAEKSQSAKNTVNLFADLITLYCLYLHHRVSRVNFLSHGGTQLDSELIVAETNVAENMHQTNHLLKQYAIQERIVSCMRRNVKTFYTKEQVWRLKITA